MENDINSEKKPKKAFSKRKLLEKYNTIMDGLFFVASLWLTILIIFSFYSVFEKLGSVFLIILVGLLLFVLIYITLDCLRIFISAGLVILIIFLFFFLYHTFINQDEPIKSRIVEYVNVKSYSNNNNIEMTLDSIRIELNKQTQYKDSLTRELVSFKSMVNEEVDSLKSLSKKGNSILTQIHEQNIKEDSLNEKL
ncbi:MAG: hypothetical protein ACOCVX_05335 [Bacteroidales bacterium]|jgi:predicted PurR-regulated permease PerM